MINDYVREKTLILDKIQRKTGGGGDELTGKPLETALFVVIDQILDFNEKW